jgi:hypothetical protein
MPTRQTGFDGVPGDTFDPLGSALDLGRTLLPVEAAEMVKKELGRRERKNNGESTEACSKSLEIR